MLGRRSLVRILLPLALGLPALLALPSAAQIPLGDSFQVNSQTAGSQRLAAVASAPDGSFVVVWESLDGPGDPAVRAQRFDLLGQEVGLEIKANLTEPLFQQALLTQDFSAPPDVAVDAAGNFLVVWAGTPAAPDIRARLFGRDGLPKGGEVVVNTSTAGEQDMPAVAALPGGFVVAWVTNDHLHVRARLLDATGSPVNGEIEVDPPGGGLQHSPDVAAAPGGGFVVAWSSEGTGDPDSGVAFRRFDALGAALGPLRFAHSQSPGNQGEPSVASDGVGHILITWTEGTELSAPPLPDVRGQLFDAEGEPVGGVIELASDLAAAQLTSRAGMDSTGGFAVAWEAEDLTGPNDGLFARPYASTAGPLSAQHAVTAGGAGLLAEPALAMDAGGDYVVVATGADGTVSSGIFARRFTTPCVVRPGTLCLQNGRYKVEAAWRTNQGTNGLGAGVAVSADTGYFTFFNPANVEMVVKVLNGCPVNGRVWVFAGGLTNVEVDLVVTDTQSGAVRRYTNPRGTPFQPIQDTGAFASCAVLATEESVALTPPLAEPVAHESARESAGTPQQGNCVASATRLCLRDGRFAIEVDWERLNGEEGEGKNVRLTADTGYFWFFNPANVEMVIKVLNGCPVNGRYWVFAGGLTNVRALITVTDTQTGQAKSYVNPQSTAFQPIQDTGAFASCP